MKFGVCIVMGVTKKNPIFHWDMCSGFYFTVPFLRHIHDILVNCLAQPRNKALICDQETWHCPEVACTVCQNGSVMLGQSLNISRTTALLVQNITSQSTTIYKSLFFFSFLVKQKKALCSKFNTVTTQNVLWGIQWSQQNRNQCTYCFDMLPEEDRLQSLHVT